MSRYTTLMVRRVRRLECTLVAAIIWTVMILGLSALAHAETATGAVKLSEIARGSLVFRSETDGLFEPVPELDSQVHMQVSGIIARVEVRQRFRNPTGAWQEGIYVFPLPDDAAVDHMRLEVGGRVIEGRVAEREAARKTYEQAREQGRKAGLVEQERPNIFTTSVANIPPGDEITIEITYQQTVRYSDGSFHLRFPMVVGPRFIPGTRLVAGLGGAGWAPDTDQVPDASRITPPVRLPSQGLANPVSLDVDLAAGGALDRLYSPTHDIDYTPGGTGTVHIALGGDAVPADRDFELMWTPTVGATPEVALFRESMDDREHMLVTVLPARQGEDAAPPPPREVIFVIDTSGSMHGPSLRQAAAALTLALERLRPEDSFNVIQFNSLTSRLFESAVPALPGTIAQARRYVAGLSANGGTVMLGAVMDALDGRDRHDRLRQVVFLTDGSVGNEAAVFRAIAERLGDSRLFTVGIGSAPNGYFMTRAAKVGRGTYTYIGDVAEVGEKMGALLRKLERPALTDIEVRWPDGVRAEMWPAPIPDLYYGEPVVFTARFEGDGLQAGQVITLSGRIGPRPWQSVITVPYGDRLPNAGVSKAWARQKIAALKETRLDGAGPEVVRAGVLQVALAYQLVSDYTSLVAVDVTPSRPEEAALTGGAIPTNMPRGWSYAKVFGALPQTATPAELHLLLGFAALVLAGTLVLWGRRRRPA